MNELKPCPFCKSNAIMMKYVRKCNRNKRRPRGVYNVIGCTDPNCILYLSGDMKKARLFFTSRSEDVMVRRWNRRAGEQE